MSLLQTLSYTEYQKALALNIDTCEVISKLADLKVNLNEIKKPGEVLMKTLDRRGYTVEQYRQLLTTALNAKTIITYYKPQCKLAILIGNNKYKYLSKLVTPSIDCDSLASNLKGLGFIIITLKNLTAVDLKSNLSRIFESIPEDSYCFIFYAGHGCELCNTRCMLSVDCPTEDITIDDCVTENWLLKQVASCKPELCVLILDMCRNYLDRNINPKIYAALPTIEDYTIHRNLLISYSTQSSAAAYELLQIECSTTIDGTYEVKTGDTEKIVPGASLYVNALCTRLVENLDVSTLLDKIHGEMPTHTRLAGAKTGYVGLAPTKTPWCSTLVANWQGHGNTFAHIRGPTCAGRPMAASPQERTTPPSSPSQMLKTTLKDKDQLKCNVESQGDRFMILLEEMQM